jgi:hypothetical protein
MSQTIFKRKFHNAVSTNTSLQAVYNNNKIMYKPKIIIDIKSTGDGGFYIRLRNVIIVG